MVLRNQRSVGCMVARGFGSMKLSSQDPAETREVGAKVTLEQEDNCVYLN